MGGYWMYYVEYYFPLMYALLGAEMLVDEEKINKVYLTEIKQKIREEYEKLEENNKIDLLFSESDIDHLMQIDMTYEYKSVLLKYAWQLVGTEKWKVSNELFSFLYKLIETYK